MAGLFCSLE